MAEIGDKVTFYSEVGEAVVGHISCFENVHAIVAMEDGTFIVVTIERLERKQ